MSGGNTNIASGGVLDLFGDDRTELDGTTLDDAGTIDVGNGSNSFQLCKLRLFRTTVVEFSICKG